MQKLRWSSTGKVVMSVKARKKRSPQGGISAPQADASGSRTRSRQSGQGRVVVGARDQLSQLNELRAQPIKSIQYRYVVNLEDGRKYRMLTSKTLARFGLTPREYRMKWGLSPGQPLLARSLLATRRDTARELGLGYKLQTTRRERIGAWPKQQEQDDRTRKRAPRKRGERRKPTREVRPKAPVSR